MKLAGLCPIGSLADYGYQHVYWECIASQAQLCDEVFLFQSLDDPRNLPELLAAFQNVRLISNEFTLAPGGVYSVDHSKQRAQYDQKYIRDAGFDVVLLLSSNWYISETRLEGVRRWCDSFYAFGEPVGWIYRSDQLSDRLFHSSKRLPYLLRADSYPTSWLSYVPDGAFEWGELKNVESGNFSDYDQWSLIDVPMEMTLNELKAKIDFVRGYHDILPKRPEVFEWEYWQRYYFSKFKQKKMSAEKLSPTGKAIADKHRSDFVSEELLRSL